MLKYFKFSKHYSDIKKYGIKEFFKKIKIFFLILLNYFLIFFFAIPVLILCIIISPLILIRFGIIRSSRVGHFLANTELYLCRKKLKLDSQPCFDFISFDENVISNSFLKKNYERELTIFPNFIIKPFCTILLHLRNKNNYFNKFEINVLNNSGGDRDLDGLFYKIENSIKFDSEDIKKIEKELKNFGLDFSSKFICLDVRDDAYLKFTFPKNKWDYHNYRDWDINNFVKASENLTKRGYKVLRMGKIVNEKMVTKNPMIIDYATSEFKSDILDIYLHAKCYFTATTGSGIDVASYATRRPMAMMVVPAANFYTFKNTFHVTKHHKFTNSGIKLSLTEMFESGYAYDTNQINYKKITLEELTANEISDYLIEVLDILEGKFLWNEENKYIQSQFWNNYKNLIQKNNLGYLHKNYEAIFSPVHLKNNPQLLK